MASLALFAQKDLQINLISPENGRVYQVNKSEKLLISFKNVGTDSIEPADSAFLFMKQDGFDVFGNFYNLPLQHAGIATGDSIILLTSLGFTQTTDAPSELCFEVITSRNGAPFDANTANNKSCSYVTVEDAPNSTYQPTQAALISIYPNPARNIVTISAPAISNGTVVITDINGKELLSAPLTGGVAHLAVEGLPSGVYLCRLVNSGNQVTTIEKLIICN